MEYTHYWTFKKPRRGLTSYTERQYQKAIEECAALVRRYAAEFGGLSGYTAHTKKGQYGGLNVNGSGVDGHEDFILREHFNQNFEDGNGFNFCKTAGKTYDLVVVACLCIMKHRLGNLIDVSSDGRDTDWNAGLKYARAATKLKMKNPIAPSDESNESPNI